jgi:hypothetical protein
MTMRDPEVLDVLRNEPELLALADALADTQRPRSSRLRRLSPRAAGVAAVAAGIAAVVLLWPGGSGNNSILGRAAAALGDDAVLHLVGEGTTGEVLVNLASGERKPQTMRIELWSDRGFDRAHFVMRVHGLAADFLLPEDLKRGVTVGATDPAFGGFWTGYRKALDDGDATVERSGTIDGHDVYWLRFDPTRKGVPGTEVAIDRQTYKPVVLRSYVTPTKHDDVHVLVAETIPFDRADFKRVGKSLFGAGSSVSKGGGSSSTAPPEGRPVVKAPWLTPGEEAAGLKLSSVGSTSTTTHGRTLDGIELLYGAKAFGPDSLTIDELPKPDDPVAWKYIPSGWMSIQKGSGSDGRQTFDTWSGKLAKDGVYVTIDTAAGENAVLDVARSLERAG